LEVEAGFEGWLSRLSNIPMMSLFFWLDGGLWKRFRKLPQLIFIVGCLASRSGGKSSEIDDQTGSQLVEVAVIHFYLAQLIFQSCIIQDDLSTSDLTDPKL
jgi:hypothetical protein